MSDYEVGIKPYDQCASSAEIKVVYEGMRAENEELREFKEFVNMISAEEDDD